MISEDIRINKGATGTETTVAVGTSSVQLLAADPTRISFTVSGNFSGSQTISSKGTAVAGSGICLPSGFGAIKTFTVAEFGSLIQGAWTAISNTAAQNVNVFELKTANQG